MSIRPPARPQTLLRAVVKPRLSPSRIQCRRKHSPAVWQDGKKQERFAQYGVAGFLSARTYEETYVKYSQHLCDQLNLATQGTADESKSVFDIHAQYAHQPSHAALYNYAAMAHHTHFFWESLSDTDVPAERQPGIATRKHIEEMFDSVDQLRIEILEAADAMFGNGFVWLMKDISNQDQLTILCTYNAGSPYPQAHARRDTRDMANHDGRNLAALLSGKNLGVNLGPHTAGAMGDHSQYKSKYYAGALDARPILCVNVWQHMYLPDYGILGKRAYLNAWWEHIDWQVVERRYTELPGNRPWDRTKASQSRFSSVLDTSLKRHF